MLRQKAEDYADSNIDCICDPNHPYHDTGTCWHRLSSREQYISAFLIGMTCGLEHAAELCGPDIWDQEVAFKVICKEIEELKK
jgi:hypothetical protein